MMAELAEKLLVVVADRDQVGTLELSKEWGVDHQKLVGAVKSLQCGDVVEAEMRTDKVWDLTEEGKVAVLLGSPESRVLSKLREMVSGDGGGKVTREALMSQFAQEAEVGKVGFSKAMAAKWIVQDSSGGILPRPGLPEVVEDPVQRDLKALVQERDHGGPSDLGDKVKQELKKRKMAQETTLKSYLVRKGPGFRLQLEKAETELTPEMIASGSWKGLTFKPYNFAALGIHPGSGHLHPLLKVRAEYRQIFLEMGFSEMPTNNFVESSFWNFDALFQPQQHPARDAHDTFFLSDPAEARADLGAPPGYVDRVAAAHSHGGGVASQGYGYDWKVQEARKNLLRTHTTAVSARMLHRLARECCGDEGGSPGHQGSSFKAKKYFSIDRVFRNETLDATHLAEFHQIEGLVADRGLTLGDLIGVIYAFFQKLGIEKLRFKPAYNPYTEPSMEIFSYHPGLAKWVEIGNSGVFRPEMLLPMGLPEDVNVIAWGLSLERPTMIKYGIDNIRDLVGHKVNLKMVQENPLCRLDKNNHNGLRQELGAFITVTENRWRVIEERLAQLQDQVAFMQRGQERRPHPIKSGNTTVVIGSIRTTSTRTPAVVDVAVHADPAHPPYSLRAVAAALGGSGSAQVHVHSSCTSSQSGFSPKALAFFEGLGEGDLARRGTSGRRITLIWSSSSEGAPGSRLPWALLGHQGKRAITGEVNILRHLVRTLFPISSMDNASGRWGYGNGCSAPEVSKVDEVLDKVQLVLDRGSRQALKEILGANLTRAAGSDSLLVFQNRATLADLALLSACRNLDLWPAHPYLVRYRTKCLQVQPDFKVVLS